MPAASDRAESAAVGFVDIHAHLLPGIDDGPDDLDESVAMLAAAGAAGTSTVVATPHLRADFPGVDVFELAQRCHALRAAAEDLTPAVTVVGGAEISLGWALAATDEELALASYGRRGHDLLALGLPRRRRRTARRRHRARVTGRARRVGRGTSMTRSTSRRAGR